MNVYDKASRRAAHHEPVALCARLGELAKLRRRFVDWTQTQTTPKVEGRDQTADHAAVLEDLDVPGRLWLALVEFQSRHEPDKLDDLFAEAAQFRRTLKHGEGRDKKYAVMPVLVDLTGACPEEGRRLDLRSPGGLGMLHAPTIWEIGEDSASDSLDAYEQGKTTWGILFWVALMKGADDPAVVTRWLELVQKLTLAQSVLVEMRGIAAVFSGLVGRGQVWRRILEGWKMTESVFVNEWIEESKVQNTRDMLLVAVKKRYSLDTVPADVAKAINEQPDLSMLRAWFEKTYELPTIDAFRDYSRC